MYKKALEAAKQRLKSNSDVQKIGYGFKYTNGKRTDTKCISVTVTKKLPKSEVAADKLIPTSIQTIDTDVCEGTFESRSLITRRRPCPPGYSIGHTSITAGTFGFPAYYKDETELSIFSNNHVLAASNAANLGDAILQPGRYDGGEHPYDTIATLSNYVKINFPGDGGGKKDKKVSQVLWKLWKWPANKIAQLVGCPYRLTVNKRQLDQPDPNLVDLAWAKPIEQLDITTEYPFNIGELNGIRDLILGDKVHKVGRTTEHTFGEVISLGVWVKVSYGGDKIATYDDQLEIAPGDFSAGGDSGSAVLTGDNFLGALLFAGSDESTIVTPIRHILAYGQFRL